MSPNSPSSVARPSATPSISTSDSHDDIDYEELPTSVDETDETTTITEDDETLEEFLGKSDIKGQWSQNADAAFTAIAGLTKHRPHRR